MLSKCLPTVIVILVCWCVLSFCASLFQVAPQGSYVEVDDKMQYITTGNACGKTYPINYILYSRLFCEIKDSK